MRLRHFAACLLAAGPIFMATAAPAAAVPARPDLGTRTLDTAVLGVTISLRSPHEQQLRLYAAAVSSPGNSRYRRYLSIAELRERFGAPSSTVRRVAGWAKAAGFRVGAVDSTGMRLPLTGTVATIRRAFGVTLYDDVRARSATAVRLPPPIAADVAAVSGLNAQPAQPMHAQPVTARLNTRGSCLARPDMAAAPAASCLAHPAQNLFWPSAARPPANPLGPVRPGPLTRPGAGLDMPLLRPTAAPQVCATEWAQPDVAPVHSQPAGRVSVPLCGYTGPQLRTLYGLAASDDGAGQTIVIVGAYDKSSTLTDANAAFAVNGVEALPASQYRVKTYPAGGDPAQGCDPADWGLEQALDVQTAHTLAPAARIVYASAPDCTHLTDTLAQVIADPDLRGAVISSSWGYPAEALSNDELAATDAILARAAVLGTGTYAASGVYGSGTTTGMWLPDLAYPASSPWITAVGGTTTAIGPGERMLWQTGWASTAIAVSRRRDTTTTGSVPITAASGGGFSLREAEPAWQPRNPRGMRQVPDLAALADPNTGFLVGTTIDGQYGVGPVGGTSLASPIVASLAALAQARTGHSAGLLAPMLWHRADGERQSALSDVRHVDAVVWTPDTFGAADDPSGYLIRVDSAAPSSGPGWDPVTGLGVPGRTFLSDVG